MDSFLRSTLLLFALLNPFLMSIYLLDLLTGLDGPAFRRVLVRGSLIAGTVFLLFAATGDALFRDVLQVRYASFLMFGGVIFLIIGIRYVMVGPQALEQLRGEPEHIAGSIALPFMIGPGTISASVMAGARLPFPRAAAAIACAMAGTFLGLVLLKRLHDDLRQSDEARVRRYIDLVGRISALIIGTFAVDMILTGVEEWLGGPPGG